MLFRSLAQAQAEEKGKTAASKAKAVAGVNEKFADPLFRLENAAGRGPEHHAGRTVNHCYHDSTFCQVEVNTSHATASVLMDTYAHTQDKPRLELAEKIEANFYTQDLTPAAPQPRQNEKPAATKISGKEILEAIRLMDAEERRELTRALFA